MTASELAAKVQHLVPASHAALQLVGMLDQPTICNEDIAQALKCDNVLTAKLLRACNSSFYSFAEPIASVEQAVLMLGHQQILQLVFSLAFSSTMAVPLPGYAAEADELWRHSLVTALACETLVREGVDVGAEPVVAFTAGLLHDLGKLALNEVLTADCQADIRSRIQNEGCSQVEAEQAVIGTDHAEVGACLLQNWKLPPEIVEAVAKHHQPPLKPRPRLSALVHVGDCLTHLLGSALGWESFAVRVAPGIAEALELTPEKMDQLFISLQEAASQAEYLQAPA